MIVKEEAKKKTPLNLNEKSEIYQQVLERWIKSCEPLAEKDRKDLLSFMAAKLALSLSYDKIRLTPYQALEVFEKEGYLPGELYRDALTLQKLLTQAGTYPQAFHFVTNTLSTTFSHQMIEKRLESLAEQIKKASTPLLKAQKKTLQWVLKVMNSPHIECSPPSFFDELFFSMEIDQLRHEIQTALDEIYELRGKAMNGLIHKAWLDYIKAQADKIVCFDEIAPPWDKERISTPQIIMVKKALKNTDLIGKTAPTISEIVEKKDFGSLNLGAVTADEFFKHVDLKPYQLAQKKVKEAKEHFERLKMREKELIGEGISLSPIEDEQGQLIGYSAKEGTILHDLSDKLRTLICESL